MAIEYAVTEAGYVVECAIPWVEKAVEGKKFSMEMTVMDCTDGVRANEIWLFGTQVGNLYQDPSLMSEVELTADNKLVMPEPDVEPGDDKEGIDLSGANLIYGKGKLTKNEDGSVTASNEAEGLLIPIGKDVAVGEKVTVTVYGTTTGVARI